MWTFVKKIINAHLKTLEHGLQILCTHAEIPQFSYIYVEDYNSLPNLSNIVSRWLLDPQVSLLFKLVFSWWLWHFVGVSKLWDKLHNLEHSQEMPYSRRYNALTFSIEIDPTDFSLLFKLISSWSLWQFVGVSKLWNKSHNLEHSQEMPYSRRVTRVW